MKIATTKLIGPSLDWAVAKAAGINVWLADGVLVDGLPMVCADNAGDMHWQPSDSWAQGGPLLEKYNVWLSPPVEDQGSDEPYGWDADIYEADGSEGAGFQVAVGCPTALIAACRAIVAHKLGDSVDVPAELQVQE
jgi:hypothetical protein